MATIDHDVHELIRTRRSPRAFQDKVVEAAELRSLFEAARWSASCFNEQPWRFIVARREHADDHARLLACLAEPNQRWAAAAPVLILSVASLSFARNGKPNRHALHDVGAAAAQLTLQATALDLWIHQMAGFDRDKARETFSIPADFEAVAAIALGHRADLSLLPDDLRQREEAERDRRPQSEFVFSGAWETPLAL